MAPRKGTKGTAKETAVKPLTTSTGPRGTTKRPEAGADAPPVYRADMGEGLPDQSDTLNPNRAK